jgi:hypothetical protein
MCTKIEHVRQRMHGARSAKQAIAIGLSKARRAGVKVPPPPGGQERGESHQAKALVDPFAGHASALEREGKAVASPAALSRHAKKQCALPRRGRFATDGPQRRSHPGGQEVIKTASVVNLLFEQSTPRNAAQVASSLESGG